MKGASNEMRSASPDDVNSMHAPLSRSFSPVPSHAPVMRSNMTPAGLRPADFNALGVLRQKVRCGTDARSRCVADRGLWDAVSTQ